jgi:hypothetical protein
MRLQRALVAASLIFVVGLFSAPRASAAVIVLDFEGLGDLEQVLDFYNGGFGGAGSGPGPDYGIQFGSASLAVIDSDAGGSGNFANEPSPDTILFFLSGSAVMNVLDGFDTGFSFFYTSTSFAGQVTVYDGLNATGNILATLNLPALGSGCGGDPTGDFNCWDPVGVLFAGTAFSVDFSGTANFIGFDNITLGSATPGGGDVPEPATLALLGLGMCAGAVRLRRRRD